MEKAAHKARTQKESDNWIASWDPEVHGSYMITGNFYAIHETAYLVSSSERRREKRSKEKRETWMGNGKPSAKTRQNLR